MKKRTQIIRSLTVVCALTVVGLFVAGCASSGSEGKAKSKKSSKRVPVANPPTVKFGEFEHVQIKPTAIAAEHADHEGNRESAHKMDSMLHSQLRLMFPDVKVIPEGQDFAETEERTLLMEPYIENIRIISGGTRFWLGAMAGGSDLFVNVTYRDSESGEVIAKPEFSEGNNAWSGSWSMGATDNQMRDEIVMEIMGYMSVNK